jgi:galactose-1-phosphate uridylyltransferase
MSQQISRETLAHILQAEDVEAIPFSELVRLFHEEVGSQGFLPDGVCQIDPRNGDRVLFNSSRARRPHDNRPSASDRLETSKACVVCQGQTTGVLDIAELSVGFTFINKNLYPSLFPLKVERSNRSIDSSYPVLAPFGLHFLQWTSSLHDKDWHNMPLMDRIVVIRRLAALERKLLSDCEGIMPAPRAGDDLDRPAGFVAIIKNYGHLVGGSLVHGHQQIALSNVMPRRIRDNRRFERENGEKFTAYLLRENPRELIIRDYELAVLVVPYFMRRPYDMMLLVKDTSKGHLYQLNEAEVAAVAAGWHDALRAIRWIMPKIGKDIAYTVITHNGPGAGLYFEFLPYTQETGGFEHLGLWVCQSSPGGAASLIREYLSN